MAGLETTVNVAIAANPDAAIHAATRLQGVTFVSTGEELTCLGEFPVEHLDYSLVNIEKKVADEILETLRLWGIRTFAEFASLPMAGVSERLGQAGIRLQQLAAGKTDRQLRVKQPEPVFANSIELEHALSELEPLSFMFARLLHQLCAALNAYALATNELCSDDATGRSDDTRAPTVFALPDARSQSVSEIVIARHGNASAAGSRRGDFNFL